MSRKVGHKHPTLKFPFRFGLAKISKPRQRYFEGKSSADEREAYKGTLSEETAIVNKKLIDLKKSGAFQP